MSCRTRFSPRWSYAPNLFNMVTLFGLKGLLYVLYIYAYIRRKMANLLNSCCIVCCLCMSRMTK